jgi:CheY-like chemotaxis protein
MTDIQKNKIVNSGKKTILIAEDEPAVARSLKLKLEHEGYVVTAVVDGQEVLDAVSKQTYDLILLDLIMPVMDGWGVLAQLRAQNCKSPIVVASNLGQEDDIAKAKALGAVDFLVKSDTPLSEIVKKIKTYIAT